MTGQKTVNSHRFSIGNSEYRRDRCVAHRGYWMAECGPLFSVAPITSIEATFIAVPYNLRSPWTPRPMAAGGAEAS